MVNFMVNINILQLVYFNFFIKKHEVTKFKYISLENYQKNRCDDQFCSVHSENTQSLENLLHVFIMHIPHVQLQTFVPVCTVCTKIAFKNFLTRMVSSMRI